MSDEKGSLEDLPIYSFLFPNEKGSSLYNAYDRDEVENKLVIKIDQDDQAPKFSVADDISEVYGLPGIHECINGQKPLRAVIDIDASKEDMETASVKGQEVFIRICCSFIRALYRILDCGWEDILKGLIVTTSSDPSKCSYHILYAPTLLIDHRELKSFTKLVYRLTEEKFGKFIDQNLSGHNFNLRLIGSAKKGRVKRILQFSLDNGWNELDHVRVQPPSNLGLEVRPRLLSEEKNNNPLRIFVGQDILQKYAELVLQKHSSYLRDWTIEEKDSENFVYFNRKAPLECPLCKRIHDKDQRWFGRVCASSGEFIVKCFRQNSDEPGDVFECDPSIAEKIQQKNKNISLAPSTIKGPGLPKAFLKFPSWVKYNEPLSATEIYNERYVRPLPDKGDIYVGSPWETGKTYILEHLTISDDVNLLVLSTRHSYSNAVTTRLNLKSYCDIDSNINLPDHKRVVCQIESLHRITNNCKCNKKCKCSPSQYDLWLDEIVSIIAQAQGHLAGQSIEKLYKLIQEARRIIVMDNDLTDLNIEWIKVLRKDKPFSVIHNTYQPQEGKKFRLAPNKETVLTELWDWARRISSLPSDKRISASLICHLRKDVQGIVRALKTDFPELRIKEYHGKSDPEEKANDFSNVEESWSDVDLVAYTSTLKIGVSCTNPKFERAFCIFNSYIETNAGTNQMLFRMRCIKDYICHIEQRSSNVPITEDGLFRWLLNAKRECLPRELQNRGIFPDVDSIIRNKDVPSVRLWVAFMLEKFRSRRLFGWRMVDFLREAGMTISIIESGSKSNENTLSQIVKAKCSVVKADEISDITNANILDRETAEFLENKPRKTLEEMRSLDRHHIVECYEISPEILTEDFISKYGNYNHMKWFRAYRQLRDA
ncbi:14165_t:CDS:1, partial [Funneliformis geosporum]